MAEALQTGDDERAMKLFEAALSVPIRLRLMPDFESCQLASLSFQESTFVAGAAMLSPIALLLSLILLRQPC